MGILSKAKSVFHKKVSQEDQYRNDLEKQAYRETELKESRKAAEERGRREVREKVKKRYAPKPKSGGGKAFTGNPFAVTANPFAAKVGTHSQVFGKPAPAPKQKTSGNYVIVNGRAYPKASVVTKKKKQPEPKRDPFRDVMRPP